MKVRIAVISLFLFLMTASKMVQAQNYWDPRTNITGYVSTEFNFFDDLENYNVNYGTAVSEAGILITYQPTSKITLKSVFVYRPDFEFDQMLNEAFGSYAVSNTLNIKVGRFLTPLSPMNTYYYQPVNTSATLPILITNHEFFPLNIDGISVNGQTAGDLRFNYDVFAGGYRNTTWLKTGAVGFFGDEVSYFKDQINSIYTIDPSYNNTYNVAVGASAGIAYKQFLSAGVSVFKPRDEIIPVGANLPAGALGPGSPATYVVQPTKFRKTTYGFNLKLQYENAKFMGEYWSSDLKTTNTIDLEGAFAQFEYRINKLTPYVRYEDQTTDDIEYSRFTAGLNFKPRFETTFKAEYLMYNHDSGNINGLVATLIYSF